MTDQPDTSPRSATRCTSPARLRHPARHAPAPSCSQAWLAGLDAVSGAPEPASPGPERHGLQPEPSPDGIRLDKPGLHLGQRGQPHRIVALDPVSGATVPGFTPNIGGGSVRTIVPSGATLYAGGSFASASGQTRSRLAAVST